MKRFNLISTQLASFIHLPKLTFALALAIALGMSMPLNAYAQRHGGSGRMGISRSGFNHMGSGFGHVNNVRIHRGFIGPRYHWGGGLRFYGGFPGWRYSYFPFWGDYYWDIPPYTLRFYLDGSNYYDSDGIYFKKEKDKYKVVPAPIGVKVKTLPKGSLEFTLEGKQYYYYFGTYYIPVDGKYEVVQPPIGAEVDSIPDGYEKVTIDGQTYFTLNGVQYKAIMRDNVIWYRVIKNNANNAAPTGNSSKEDPKPESGMVSQ
jgi:hypothetical protein